MTQPEALDRETPCEWMGCDFPNKHEHHRVRVHTTRGGKAWAVSVEWHSGHYGTLGTSSRKYCGPGDEGYSKAVQWAHKRHATYAGQPNAIPMASVSLPTWRRPKPNA